MNLKKMGFYASLPYVVAFFSMYLGGWMADKLFGGKPKSRYGHLFPRLHSGT